MWGSHPTPMARLFILSVPATHAEGLSVCIDPSRRPGRGCSTSALCILTQIQGGEPQGVPVALLIPLPSPPGNSRTENWVLPGDGWTWITQHVHMVLMCLGWPSQVTLMSSCPLYGLPQVQALPPGSCCQTAVTRISSRLKTPIG